ncbi:MAG: SpoIIIAH-like family protein [Clostridia bacterium]|nr:SpoIIIAH-like family protein [Clostridia bacterium]
MRKSSRIQPGLNKKVLTLAGVSLLLVGAIVANYVINRAKDGDSAEEVSSNVGENAQTVTVSTAQASFFESFRTEREDTRAKEILYLDTIIEQGADAETMADAQQQKLSIVDSMEKEMTIESLLKAKGFADAAVTLHDGSVNVILSAESLADEQVAQVLDIILRETGESAENVKVSTAQ